MKACEGPVKTPTGREEEVWNGPASGKLGLPPAGYCPKGAGIWMRRPNQRLPLGRHRRATPQRCCPWDTLLRRRRRQQQLWQGAWLRMALRIRKPCKTINGFSEQKVAFMVLFWRFQGTTAGPVGRHLLAPQRRAPVILPNGVM